jgi:DNA transformation protein
MAVSPSYRTFVMEQLTVVGRVTARAMFGGVGLYHEGVFFGLMADDTLYLKVDDLTRGDYERAGMRPFRPYGEDGPAMNYCELPAEILEDRGELRIWVERAVEAARRKRGAKRKS